MVKMMYALVKCNDCGQIFRTLANDPRDKCLKCRNRDYLKVWRTKHPDYMKLYMKRWKAQHIEYIRAYKRKYRQLHPDFVTKWNHWQKIYNRTKGVVRLGSLSERRLTEIENRGLRASDFQLRYYGNAHGESYHPMLPLLPEKHCNCGWKRWILARNPLEYVCSKCGKVYS